MVETVDKSFLVPSEKTPKHPIWLSNIDLKCIGDYVVAVYVYRPNTELNIFSIADAFRVAMSKALVRFYHSAGRPELDRDGRCEIRRTGDGVLFVVGRYDGRVDEFGDFRPSPEMRRDCWFLLLSRLSLQQYLGYDAGDLVILSNSV